MSNFSDNLKKLRISMNLTQKDVADAIGTSDRNYRRYESGESDPATSTTVALADYFDVPVDYLLGRGFFKNWDALMEYKDIILPRCKEIISEAFKNNPQFLENDDILNIELERLPDRYLANLIPHLILDYKIDTEKNTINTIWIV